MAVVWLNDVSSTETIGRMDFIYYNRLNVQKAKHLFLKFNNRSKNRSISGAPRTLVFFLQSSIRTVI